MIITEEQLKTSLIKAKLITAEQYDELKAYSVSASEDIEEVLIEKNILSDENLGMIISDNLKIPFVVLSKLSIPDEAFKCIPERIARQFHIIPFERKNGELKIAMADPTNVQIIEFLAKKTGEKIVVHFSTMREISNMLHIYRKKIQKQFDAMIAHTNQQTIPVARIVDMIINYAYQDKSSDVHIEPQDKYSLVRYRIDGILHDILLMPKALHDRVVTRIKVLSRLRTDEHLTAQDGKMRMTFDNDDVDLRISIVPIADGEKVVMRLLSTKSRKYSLVSLGMRDEDLDKVTAAFEKSYGMVLSTGPTGSGKSTSIYSILKLLNTREKNITTIEDPVEYRLQGINQIQTNAKTGLTFASGLRSILRQDPNIIFVGEIRDIETAGIAVNAALTGHLVLSTLHTNDASTALPRLTDMKVEPFLVASTVNVIIAQRLVRKICDMCRISVDIDIDTIDNNIPKDLVHKHLGNKKQVRIYKGKGCDVCHGTGYVGRIGVFEVLSISNAIRALITSKADSDIIAKQAIKEGMTTMLEDGLIKVKQGSTTIEEVLRVTKVESA